MVGGGFLETAINGLANFVNNISDSKVAVGLLQVAIETLLATSGVALIGFLGQGLVAGVSNVAGAIGKLISIMTDAGGAGVVMAGGETAAAAGAVELGTASEAAAGGVGILQGALGGILSALGVFTAFLGLSVYGAKTSIDELMHAGDELKGSFESYDEASKAVRKLTREQQELKESINLANKTGEASEKQWRELTKVNQKLAVATAEMNRLQTEGSSATKGLTDSEEEAGQQASTLASHVNSANQALDAYKQSLSELPDYSSALKENAAIAKDWGKQYREGTLNYNEAMKALEFFGVDTSTINSAKELQDILKNTFSGEGYKILTSFNPYKTLATDMQSLASHGKDVGATFKWVDGQLTTDVTNWKKLSQATGLTREQLEAIIATQQETSSGFIAMTADAEEALNNIEGLNFQDGVAQFGTLQEAVEKLREANKNLDTIQIEAYIDKLKEAGLIDIGDLDQFLGKDGKIDWEKWFGDPDDVEVPVKGEVTDVEVAEDGEKPEVEVTGKVTDIDDSEIGGGEEGFGETDSIPEIEVDIEANTESIEEVWGTLDEIKSSAEDGVELEVEVDTESVEEAEEAVNELNEMEVTGKKLSVDYSDAIAGMAAWQAILDSPAVTHKYEYIHIVTIYSTQNGGGSSAATGTNFAEGGMTLVNDGTPINGSQAEIIVQDGKAFIANAGKTGFVDLKRGAKVYNASETQKILKQKGLREDSLYGTGVQGFQSFADGTAGNKPVSALAESNFYGTYGESIDYTSALFRLMGYTDEQVAQEHQWASQFHNVGRKNTAEGLYKELKHYRAMDVINDEEYYRTLYVINEAYLKGYAELQDEYWKHQEEIYKHQSDSLDDIIEKEEKLNELAKAKTQKILVYKNGMYQYIQNTEAIAKAQRDVYGYADGTTGASGGLSLVGENGPELRVLGQGDGIIPADITRNLMRMGSMPMGTFGGTSGDLYNFNIDTVKLENVNDVEGLFNGLKNLAIQRTTAKA